MREPEVIGFFVEGDNIVIANPCTIPIELLEESIKERKKGRATFIGGLMIKLPIGFAKNVKDEVKKDE